MKHRANLIFALTLAISIALLVAGFCIPPWGVIDGSVLTAVGELFGFATLAQLPAVLRRGGNVRITHGRTSIETTPPDQNPQP